MFTGRAKKFKFRDQWKSKRQNDLGRLENEMTSEDVWDAGNEVITRDSFDIPDSYENIQQVIDLEDEMCEPKTMDGDSSPEGQAEQAVEIASRSPPSPGGYPNCYTGTS